MEDWKQAKSLVRIPPLEHLECGGVGIVLHPMPNAGSGNRASRFFGSTSSFSEWPLPLDYGLAGSLGAFEGGEVKAIRTCA
jgi:hypothetical protein